MAGKRWLVHAGDITYPTNPEAQREDWEWRVAYAGEIVGDIPAVSIEHLEATGAITQAGRSTEPLPEDFPARDLLVARGWKTVGAVELHADELTEVEGIGPATDTLIRAALLVMTETTPIAGGEG